MVPPLSVLLVDADELFRAGLRDSLTEHGIDVVGECGDAEEAIDLARHLMPDVAVMDLYLPGASGAEATRVLRAGDSGCVVLMLTGSAEHEDVSEALMAGATGYLLKDEDPGLIIAAVRRAAAGEAVLSGPVLTGLLAEIRAGRTLTVRRAAGPALTDRELHVLRLLADGLDNAQIAERLGISPQTVKSHVSRLFEKLGVANRVQAAVMAVREGLL